MVKIERVLKLGKWFPEVSPVFFDKEGIPWDGQHRFMAIVRTGISAYIVAIRGVSPEAAESLDNGRKRSISDAIHINHPDLPKSSTRGATLDALAKYASFGAQGFVSSPPWPVKRLFLSWILRTWKRLSLSPRAFPESLCTCRRRLVGFHR